MMRNVWAVIRREYLQRVRTKAFVIGTIVAPLLLFGLIAIPVAIASNSDDAERRLVVVDRTDVLSDRVTPELEGLGWTVQEEQWTEDVVDRQRLVVEAGGAVAFLVLDDATLSRGEATFYTRTPPATLRQFTMSNAISRAAMEYHLERSGDAAALLDGGELTIEVLGADAPGADPDEDGAQFVIGYMGGFLLYMVILVYSASVMRATLEEKTSRIVEIIVSAMEPWHLLLGKIIGVGAVGLTQLSIWLMAGAIAASFGIPAVVAARPDLIDLLDVEAALPGVGMLLLFTGYFLLGFFMYSGLYAAVGAMCSTDEEAQHAQAPLVILLIVPMIALTPVIQEPDAGWAVALSLFPLFTPVLMWARVAAGGVPFWEIGLSFVLMVLATLAVAWLAGRIYKVGILMTGKRPTLPELWRWVRAA